MNKFLKPGSLLKTVQPISKSITQGSLIATKPEHLFPKDVEMLCRLSSHHQHSFFLLGAGSLPQVQMW